MHKIDKVYIYYTIIISLVFQPLLENINPVFQYYDESLTLILFSFHVINTIRNGKLMLKEFRIECFLILLLMVGIIGNINSGSNQASIAILVDIMSNLKLYLFLIPLLSANISYQKRGKLSDLVSATIRTLFLIMFCCALISQVINIGMTDEIRYGFLSFKFLLSNPAGLNTYFYAYMIIFSATLFKEGELRKRSTLYMMMAVITWALTLRSRAIAFSIIYIILYWFLIIKKTNRKNFKFKWYYIIPIIIIAFLIGWSTFEEYFILNSRQARYVLLRGAFKIAHDQMPFGTGFGTFGTAASRDFYSSVYSTYGMASVWGLSLNDSYFITDQYWCGILGQFGIIGTIVIGYLIFKLYKIIYARANCNTACLLAAITLIYTSLLASLAAATFIQSSILASIYTIIYLTEKESNIIKYEKNMEK